MNLQDPKRMALVRIWDAAMRGARRYVESQGFVQVHNAPEIVGITGACENVDTLFKVDAFGQQAYLAQSDQLYLELITPHIPKVWAEIQSFRAEPEIDNRHLCQFSLFELEFQGNLDDLITHIQGVVGGMAGEIVRACPEQLALFGRTPADLERYQKPYERITYAEAVDTLKTYWPELEFGDDLKAPHEAKLAQLFGPVFVTHYELGLKFFNMLQNVDDPRVVNSTDLILPFSGESAGASEREHEYKRIVARLKSSEMYKRLIALGGKDEDFAWYLDAHKDKVIPLHSGTGIGVPRVIQSLLGLEDIREATPFPITRGQIL